MENKVAREEDGTIILSIAIPQGLIKKTVNEIIEETAKSASIPGFRKGKAPRKLIEQKVDKEKIKEEVLKKLLPQAYADAVKNNDIKPIINPRIHVEKLEDGGIWTFTATTCEAPQVDLGKYKEELKTLNAKGKIIIPGKDQKQTSIEEIIRTLLENIEIKVSRIIVEQETERLLAQTLDEIKRLGITLDQYLVSTRKTVDDLKRDYGKKALDDIRLEFALAKIAEVEKITVSESEIDDAIKNAKDENERKSLKDNKYLLAGVLRQQKTLDFLRNL